MIIFYLPGLTNQPKSNTSDSDEDDETATLPETGWFFIYFFLWMCESLVEKTKKSVEHKRMRSFYSAQ